METQAGSHKNWLVKSSSRILGPFTAEEIAQKVGKKHLSLVDEVKRPDSRWTFIRDNTAFKEVIEKVRNENDQRNEQTASGSSTKTLTGITATKTQTQTQESSGELTSSVVDVKSVRLDEKALVPVSAPEPESILVPTSLSPISASEEDTVTVAVDHSLRPKVAAGKVAPSSSATRAGTWLQWGILAVSICILSFVSFGLYQSKKKILNYKELQTQALYFKGVGLYDKSIQSYNEAVNKGSVDPESQFQMALLLISIERQTSTGRKILETELASAGSSRQRKIESYLGIGISHLLESNLPGAEESFLQVIGLDPGNPWAKANLSIISQLKGQYEAADKYISEAIKKYAFDPSLYIIQGLNLIEMSRGSQNVPKIQEYLSTTGRLLESTHAHRLELRLIRSFLYSTLGDRENYQQSVKDFLSEFAFENSKYFPEINLEGRLASWDNLERYCLELSMKEEQVPMAKAMRAVCLLQVGRDLEARKLLDEAVLSAPKDQYVNFTLAQVMNHFGLRNEALAVFKTNSMDTVRNARVLKSSLCLDTLDLQCVESLLGDDLSKMSPFEVSIKARYLKAIKKDAEILNVVQSGIMREPRYVPLIELSVENTKQE